MAKKSTVNVQGKVINISVENNEDYICLTDMAKSQEENVVIIKWLSSKNTIEFLGAWEMMNNPAFNSTEYGRIRNESGGNNYVLSVKNWIESTNAIGIIAKAGRYGGTYAHKDIAFEFGTWISPVFKLYLIKEFQRLKELESNTHNIEWNVKRVISKANYHLHTSAVQKHRLPLENIQPGKEGIIYADEAEILNYAVFGCSSKQWKEQNQQLALQGQNIRDYASINELAVLSNMESLNSIMLASGMAKKDRIAELRRLAQQQLQALNHVDFAKSYKRTVDGTFQNQIDKPAKAEPPLSDFDTSLKTALNYNPKEKGE